MIQRTVSHTLPLIVTLLLHVVLSCDDTQFSHDNQQFDVKRLTSHALPQQTYEDTSNYYAHNPSKTFKLAFNIMDIVKKQTVDNLAVPEKCGSTDVDSPAACYFDSLNDWIPIGSCVNVKKSYNSDLNSVQLLYGVGLNAVSILLCLSGNIVPAHVGSGVA